MKMLQKYTNVALLLISATTMAPAYASPTLNKQEQTTQEEMTDKSQTTKNSHRSELIWDTATVIGISVTFVLAMDIALHMIAEHQFKKYGYVTMRGWEVVDGKPIKTKSIKAC